MARAETPNKALHLTGVGGAAILVARDNKLLQRPRQVSLVVRQPWPRLPSARSTTTGGSSIGKPVSVTLLVPSGTHWITTDGNQIVHFEYFGLVTRVIICKPAIGQAAKYYDGPPIPSWGSPGFFGLNLEGSGSVIYRTIVPG